MRATSNRRTSKVTRVGTTPKDRGTQRSASWSRGPRRKAWGRSGGRVQGAPESADVRWFGVGVLRQRSIEDAGGMPVHKTRARARRTPVHSRGRKAQSPRDRMKMW
eukprot:6177373-Pleurochrysis_carterae.AAC.3